MKRKKFKIVLFALICALILSAGAFAAAENPDVNADKSEESEENENREKNRWEFKFRRPERFDPEEMPEGFELPERPERPLRGEEIDWEFKWEYDCDFEFDFDEEKLEEFKAEMIEKLKEQLEEHVLSGKITREQADGILSRIEDGVSFRTPFGGGHKRLPRMGFGVRLDPGEKTLPDFDNFDFEIELQSAQFSVSM